MARMAKTSRNTHRMDLCAAARLGPIMQRRRDAGLSVVAPAVAKNVLWSLVNFGGQDGRAWPSRKTLADEAETSLSSVRRVLEIFAAEGLIRDTIQRTRGPGAGRKSEAHDGATNVYLLDYEVLARWAEDDEDAAQGEPRTRPNLSRVPGERGSVETRTRLSGDTNAAQIGGASKEEPKGTGIEPPPQPPRGGEPEVGGQSTHRQAEQPLLAEQAREILAAYPRTSSDIPDDDAQAAVDAIQREADTPERCTWVEIREAARTVRAANRRDPLWPRTWLRRRGYLPLVLDARARDDASRATPIAQGAEASERFEAAAAETDAALRGLSDEQLAELHQRLLDGQPNEFSRRALAQADPRRSAMLRAMLADLIRREAA